MDMIISALLPVFLLILGGYVMKRQQFPGDAFWPSVSRFVYYVAFPTFLVVLIAKANFQSVHDLKVAEPVCLAALVIVISLVATRRYWPVDGAEFSSLYQASIRPNTYIGVAVTDAFLGTDAVALLSVCVGVSILVINLLAVTGVGWYAAPGQVRLSALLRMVLLNPLILASVLGIGLNITGIGLPSFVGKLAMFISGTALPLGLLSVGAGIELSSLKKARGPIVGISVIKLLMLPGITWGISILLDLPPLVTTVAVLYASLPCAPACYMLAREMGGDVPILAALISLHTVLSAFTVPMFISVVA